MPATHGPQGTPPHTFIFKLLHFKDRDMELREARALQELKFENARLMIFPDYSMETQRQSFDAVRAKLRAKGLKYSMLFPAMTAGGRWGNYLLFQFTRGGLILD